MREYFFPLKDRKKIAEDTFGFWLDTSGTDYTFIPGQYAAFTIKEETKVFTLASSPHHKDHIVFATRMRPSPFKEDLKKLPLGTKVKVSPPRGRFILPEAADRPLVMIAGGIGVTPFRSMIEWAVHEKKKHFMKLFYSNRTPALTAFLKDFQEWGKQNDHFTFIPTLTQDKPSNWTGEAGRVDAAMLRKYNPGGMKPVYFVAGPPAMVDSMKQILLGLDIYGEDIHTEKFSGY